jgi:hypothetical protein
MSMTQVAFLRKAKIPTKEKIETLIRELGYEFEFIDNFELFYGLDGVECNINGHKTFFELYFEEPAEIGNEWPWIKPDLTNQDTIISFVWGADFAAGACIGLICIALIDLSEANIYYLDDEMKYSREMLINDTPQFLHELEKQKPNNAEIRKQEEPKSDLTNKPKSFLDRIKDIFK